jgi:hypothetical protein
MVLGQIFDQPLRRAANSMTSDFLRRATLTAISAIVGYVVLALLSTLVQELWLGGVSYWQSSLSDLWLGGTFTTLSGVVAGFVVSLVARRMTLLAAITLCVGIAVETTYLFARRIVDGPLWFEAGAGAALILAVLSGATLGRHANRTEPKPTTRDLRSE